MVGFVVLGGILFVIGVIVTLVNLKNWKRRQRIIATPTSPVAQAPGNGLVEIKGRIVPALSSKNKVDEIRLANELAGQFRAQYLKAAELARSGQR